MTLLTGGCLCGAIRYEAEGDPFHETLCHCETCRRATGAPAVAWLTMPRASFRFTSGTPTTFASSDEGRRRFCPACGTALTFESSDYPDETDLTAASLDHPALAPPRDHTWSTSALEWFWTLHRLPQREKAPPDL
jgi:hypothetical protein